MTIYPKREEVMQSDVVHNFTKTILSLSEQFDIVDVVSDLTLALQVVEGELDEQMTDWEKDMDIPNIPELPDTDYNKYPETGKPDHYKTMEENRTMKAEDCPRCGFLDRQKKIDDVPEVKDDIPELTDADYTKTIGDYQNLVQNVQCAGCGTTLEAPLVDYYSHDAGWNVAGVIGKQWLSVNCYKCRYDTSLNKIGIHRPDGRCD
jgi:hypothetical protein